jgi:hypothetical protein
LLEKQRGIGFVSTYFDPMDIERDPETRAVFIRMMKEAVARGWNLQPVRTVERTWRQLLSPLSA